MRSPADMDILQVDITPKCHLRCSNCTRGVSHYAKPWEMDLPTFESAVQSLEGWNAPGKVVGIIGGEPTLHSEFERISLTFADMWGGPKTNNGREPIADLPAFIQRRLFDRSNGRGLWTSLGPGFAKHMEVVLDVYSHFNTNTHEAGGLHQAMWISRKDYCEMTGMSSEEWEKNRDACWLQNMWSATINDKGAYPCEVMGTIDRLLYDGKHAWPAEKGWWERKPEDFGAMLELCNHCSLAQPAPSQVDAVERDIVSPENLVQLEMIGSPAVKKERVDVFNESFTERRVITTKDNYVNDGVRVTPAHRSIMPKRLTLIVTCVGRRDKLELTLRHNAPMFDEVIIVGDQHPVSITGANWLLRPHDTGDAAFNKGYLLNEALADIRNPDWIVFADADVFLNARLGEFIRSHALNPGCLYWADRYDVNQANPAHVLGQQQKIMSQEPNGFFQLFNRRALAIRDRWPRLMSEDFCSAGGIDTWFYQQWPADKRIKIPLPVKHIMHSMAVGEHWNGASNRTCWRQIGVITHHRLELLSTAPDNFREMRLRLTDTKYGESVFVEPGVPLPIRQTDDGLWLGDRFIGGCHIHVAARCTPEAPQPEIKTASYSRMGKVEGANGILGRFLELKRGGFHPKRILDVGASIGEFCELAKRVWPEVHVTSVEANALCTEWLSKAADEMHIALLSDSERDVTYWTNKDNPLSQGNSYYKETLSSFPHELPVPMRTTTLAQLLGDKEAYDLIKLDTQGSELDIIRGGREIVRAAQYVLCEMQCDTPSNDGAPTRLEVESELAALGFGGRALLEWWCDGSRRVNEDWIYRRLA